MKLVRQFFVITLFCFSTVYVAASDAKTNKDLSTLPEAAQSSISAALGRDLADYHIRTTNSGLEAANSHGALKTRFTTAGVQVTSRNLHWTMTMRGYGYGDAITAVAKALPHANQNRVEYRRGPLTEWYENGPVGLEQGFTLTEPPAKRSGKPLTIAIELMGNLHAEQDADGMGLQLLDSKGSRYLHYASLSAQDASGKDLQASLEVKGKRLFLRIYDDGAVYPLQIDPLIQLAELTASNGAKGNLFGSSVAMSGNMIVVGAPEVKDGGNNLVGAAYVFVKPASGWANMTQTAKLSCANAGSYVPCGSQVAISGNTIVTGGYDSTILQYVTLVFVEPSGGWRNMTQTAELTGSDGGTMEEGINAVAISGDTILAGDPISSVLGFEEGEVYLYVKPASGWVNATQTAILSPSDGGQDWLFGWSVALDGDVAVIGAIDANMEVGAAYVFVEPDGGWVNMTQTAKLTASDGAYNNLLGVSVAISGATVVAGAPDETLGSNPLQGAAYVFVEPSAGWQDATETAKLTLSSGGKGNNFGDSVSASGNTILVGAPNIKYGSNVAQGAAYIFNKPASGWATTGQPAEKFSAGAQGSSFGGSVLVAGTTAVVGAPTGLSGGQRSVGAAYVFGP
ncbi:MAG: hypothetical protein WAL56_12555 [Candidatus Sulfotelmatobacter sp.]